MIKIFSKTIRTKSGKILKASDYGLKAFCFEVAKDKHKKYLEAKKKIS